MEIWEPKPPGTLWATPGLLRDCFTVTFMVCKSWLCYGEFTVLVHSSYIYVLVMFAFIDYFVMLGSVFNLTFVSTNLRCTVLNFATQMTLLIL